MRDRDMGGFGRSVVPHCDATASPGRDAVPDEQRNDSYRAYLNRVQSSRRLEREAGRNVEVRWLTSRLVPDHKTIA